MRPKILIVDDEEAVSSMLKMVFETDGWEVATAGSAAAASTLVAAQTFDVVLTDMKMETDDAGFRVVRAARKGAERTIIVILTAFPLLAREWRSAGADAALAKPTHMSALLGTVRELLDQRRRAQPLS